MANHTVLAFKGGIGGVVRGAGVGLALFVDTLWNVRRGEAGNPRHLAEEVVDHVTPVAEHVDDHPAAIFLAVVPGRALRRDRVALEDPVTELAPDGEDIAEEVVLDEALKLDHARQPELVLDHAVLHSSIAANLIQFVSVFGFNSRGFLAIDMLTGSSGLLDGIEAAQGGLGIEVNRIGRIIHHAVKISGIFLNTADLDEIFQLCLIAADKNGIGHDDFFGTDLDAALFDDRVDGAEQVLVGAHASGDAVHDDADCVCFHGEVTGGG